MTLRKDKIIVVDLEATCWEGPPPVGQENEIIEVGICVLELEKRTLSQKKSFLIRPTRSIISPFCTQLTGLTQQDVAFGYAFGEACEMLEKEYDTRNYLWTSWGAYDRHLFRQQCQSRDMRYPFSSNHMNLKRLYADANEERMPMVAAIKHLGLELEGQTHRGDDDAWNTGRILIALIEKFGEKIVYKYW
ncbi:3'-5' exonuclease [Anaerolineales bacterium]